MTDSAVAALSDALGQDTMEFQADDGYVGDIYHDDGGVEDNEEDYEDDPAVEELAFRVQDMMNTTYVIFDNDPCFG